MEADKIRILRLSYLFVLCLHNWIVEHPVNVEHPPFLNLLPKAVSIGMLWTR